MRPDRAFFAAAEAGDLVVAIPGKLARFPINTAQGTFLANADSSTARALAAIMGCHDAYLSQVNTRGECSGRGEDSC